MEEQYDVIIVGGGLGGLVATHLLLKERNNLKIQVLETSDHLCGPLKTIELEAANGKDYFDIGVSRVGSVHPLMLALLQELGIETYTLDDLGTKHWQLPDGKIKTYEGDIPPVAYTALNLIDFGFYSKKIDKLAKNLDLKCLAATENCSELDDTTMDQFIEKSLKTQGGKDMARTMIGTLCGLPPDQLSLLLYLCMIRSCGNWDNHIGGEDSDLLFKGGCQQLAERLQEKVGDDKITTGDGVTRIEQSDDMTRARVYTQSGRELETKFVILTIPGSDICKIELAPPLDVPHQLPTAEYGVQFVITYKKNFWREKKMAGEFLSMAATLGSFKDEKKYPIVLFADSTSANGNPALSGVFGSPCYAEMTSDERKQIAVDFIASVLGEEARDIIEYRDECWNTESVTMDPGLKTSEIMDSLLIPHGCIHFAGEETGAVWSGSMESTVEASNRVVKEVLGLL
ncbi:amine oxidase [flavin-containing] A-like [Lytechinus pictus]|uniref:amine oxidase [flavin-containing] A-like n=1 Tax=Lytechinus pictus TaxID=7653 RepID=UPI0030B9EA54